MGHRGAGTPGAHQTRDDGEDQVAEPWWEEGDVRGDQAPAFYITDGEWPHARLRGDAPISAHYGQEVARRLRSVMDDQGLTSRPLAQRSGLSKNTISRTLNGQVLPDLGTLARLEAALGTSLYPTGLYQRISKPGSGRSEDQPPTHHRP